MPDPKNTVDEARKLLEDRRAQLHEELKDLEKAISALGGQSSKSAKPAASRTTGRRRGRPAGSTNGRRRRRRKGGTRSEQAVKLLTDKPGLTASEIATDLGIKPNYMYRVLSDLQGEKQIRKDGRKYYAAGSSSGAGSTGKS